MGDTLLWWIALGYDAPRMMAETIKAAGTEPDEIVGYLNKLKDWPGVYGDITFTPEQHNGFPDEEVVMCEVNSLQGRRVQPRARLQRLDRCSNRSSPTAWR